MTILDRVPGLLLVLALVTGCAPSTPGPEADLVIIGGTLIDGSGAPPQEGMTIVVDDGRIASVVPEGAAELPDGARVVDAAGKYVVPGFADMHVHFGSGGSEGAESTTPDRVLRQFLFYGVTTVFSVGAGGGDAASIRALRSRAVAGEVTAPHIYATGSMLTLPGSHPVATIMRVPDGADPETYDWSTRGVALVETLGAARAVVRANARAGMDGIKIVIESGPTGFGDDHPQMPLAMVAAVVEEASSLGLPVGAHVSSLDELEDAVAGGVRAILHAANEPYPGPEHWAAMREGEVFYVPTLSLFAPILSDRWTRAAAFDDPFLRAGVAAKTLASLEGWRSPMASVPDAVRARFWNEGLGSIGSAHEAGVPIAVGTDTSNPFVFPGYSVHVELELLVEAGLSPMDALVAATRRPAEMLRKDDEFGTVEVGKRADLLVLAADPLADIRNTRSLQVVIRGGEVVERYPSLSNQ